MEEIHRIALPNAQVEVLVPTASSPYRYIDPTHLRGYSYRSFDYFVEGSWVSHFAYSSARFEVLHCEFTPLPGRTFGWLDRAMTRLANLNKHFYENRLSYIYPMAELRFLLRTVK
jgi:hypothetical protein